MAKAKPRDSDATPANRTTVAKSAVPLPGGAARAGGPKREKLTRKQFEKELLKLQRELVIMQEYVRAKGPRVVVIFEGRDAAGKGGVIKRIAERTNPRVCRVVALPEPTEREKTQWYFQRFVPHLPAAGEIVLFDRSWYNRAGVERVMEFCTEREYEEFMRSCPEFERMLLRSGIQVVKYWFSVSDKEQERRFQARVHDPMRRWKLSPMDLESRARWVAYSRAKDEMFRYTDIKVAPWYVVEADDKRRIGLPVIDRSTKQLRFHVWYPGCPMEEDAFGIPKPKDTAQFEPALLLVPCVGYGPDGTRLGYGGGFYDRTPNPTPWGWAMPTATSRGCRPNRTTCHWTPSSTKTAWSGSDRTEAFGPFTSGHSSRISQVGGTASTTASSAPAPGQSRCRSAAGP